MTFIILRSDKALLLKRAQYFTAIFALLIMPDISFCARVLQVPLHPSRPSAWVICFIGLFSLGFSISCIQDFCGGPSLWQLLGALANLSYIFPDALLIRSRGAIANSVGQLVSIARQCTLNLKNMSVIA